MVKEQVDNQFPDRGDTGPRLRNSVAKCFIIDASRFPYIIADALKEEDLKIEHKSCV